jgi:GTPase SAR1 family protein
VVNNEDSFGQLDQWLTDLYNLAPPNAVIILVGNRVYHFLKQQRTMGLELQKFSCELQTRFWRKLVWRAPRTATCAHPSAYPNEDLREDEKELPLLIVNN